MTLLYMEGFDIHRSPSGWTDGDASSYWRLNTLSNHAFVDGYQGGQALAIRNKAIFGSGGASSAGTYRIGFWANGINKTTGAGYFPFVSLKAGSGGEYRYFFVGLNGDGQFQLYQSEDFFNPWDGRSAISVEGGAVFTEGWAYYEVFVDYSAPSMTISRNGTEVLASNSGDSYSIPSDASVDFKTIGEPGSWDFDIDHFWITDGPALAGDGVCGLSINVAQDRYEGLGGFRGSLMFGETRYQTEWSRSQVTSITSGENNCNVMTYVFPEDPRDNSFWSTSKYNDITKWGICHYNPYGYGNHDTRVDCMSLNKLDYNDGQPLITTVPPGPNTTFNGTWTKTDTSKTYAAHLNTYPRPDVATRVEADSIYTKTEGCLLFNQAGDTEQEDLSFGEIGVTFAEEFRTDYQDWVNVFGPGGSFDSYFTSGYGIFGEANKQFQNNYVTVNYENVITGGAYIQGLWDYAIDPNTGRWSMKQQVYRTNDDGHLHAARKLKIRGHGKALQLRVVSEGDKPFTINGWSLLITSNGQV